MVLSYGVTNRNECRREPAFPVGVPAPPPVLVQHVFHLDDVTGTESQFHRVESHVIPQSFCAGGIPGFEHLLQSNLTVHNGVNVSCVYIYLRTSGYRLHNWKSVVPISKFANITHFENGNEFLKRNSLSINISYQLATRRKALK